MPSAAPQANQFLLARQAREQFVKAVEAVLPELVIEITNKLKELENRAGAASSQGTAFREAGWAFQKQQFAWTMGARTALQKAVAPAPVSAAPQKQADLGSLALVDHEVIENQVLAARLSDAIREKAEWEINQLQARMQHLEGGAELHAQDVFRTEVVAGILLDQWIAAGMSRDFWKTVQDAIHRTVVKQILQAFKAANKFLIDAGVLPEGAYKVVAKKVDPRAASAGAAEFGHSQMPGAHAAARRGAGWSESRSFAAGAGRLGSTVSAQEFVRNVLSSTDTVGGIADAVSRLNQVRQQAEDVMGQLQRMLRDRVPEYETTRASPLSHALKQAIAHGHDARDGGGTSGGWESRRSGSQDYGTSGVVKAAGELRERSQNLKKKAGSHSEKATIEVVALMFDSILGEERLPSGVRVWFSRLQMPVLREALNDPEFFESLNHPARLLLDRMGSCVMGFEAAPISDTLLEAEIKRIVQMIEQYPETGPKVYELVYAEFQEFLAKHLPNRGTNQRTVGVAQQVEQRETLLIQYTIELRDMLSELPVREQIREFLFKVWAEVLAVAAVKNGPQHQETIELKRAAADLVWAASAKPSRKERARVIQDLPQLLARLRRGMTLMGLESGEQEAHIKAIGDTLADAFLSKTEAISQEKIDAMAARLANLEDYFSDVQSEGLPLDLESIELMIGVDAASIVILTDGDVQPYPASIEWARQLQLGAWSMLDHNGQMDRVQYVWQSERKQLHLLSTVEGKSYLIQLRRLASYLQTALLAPQEEETLTVRATRKALAKLDANPERLLN